MGEFIEQALTRGSIVQLALLAGLVASLSFGVVGSYVVARRISYMAAAIAHSVLGGIGFAIYAEGKLGWTWVEPLYGALAAAIFSAVLIGWVSLYLKEREDTVISAVWATGMSLGLMFLYLSPQRQANLESFIMGSILYIEGSDVWIMAGLGVVVVAASLLFYNQLQAVCFDEEFARLRGVNVPLFFFMLLVLTGLSVVLLVRLAGVVLAIALIVLPAAIGLRNVRKLWHGMVVAVIVSMFLVVAGIGYSYVQELPAGPTIILLAAAAYFLTLVARGVVKRARRKVR